MTKSIHRRLTPSVVAQFDDLTGQSVGSDPVPTPYQSLRFGTFSVAQGTSPLDSLPPHSLPNRAGSGLRGQTTAAEPPRINFAYNGSILKSFDLESLYFGCIVQSVTTDELAIGCTVQVTGVKADTGDAVGPKLINFAPPSEAGTGVALQAAMAYASFSDFTRLSKVVLHVMLSSIPEAQQQATVLFIDHVVHTNYE
ncbi:MAG: hypothetical protein M1826_003543 [Phylliscum demangeonii]|nr:MAG: hypothetical protein M1826_003543 [Phylliscum demangeonii]